MNDPMITLFATPSFAVNHETLLRTKAAPFIDALKSMGIETTSEYHNPRTATAMSATQEASHIERRAINKANESLILHFGTRDGKEHIVRLYHGLDGDHIVHACYTPKSGVADPKELDDFKATWVPKNDAFGMPHGLPGLIRVLKLNHM